jgi:hypothetical protein
VLDALPAPTGTFCHGIVPQLSGAARPVGVVTIALVWVSVAAS